MSYRTIALASCVFVVACGGAPPPAAEAARAPSDPASAAARTDAATDEKKLDRASDNGPTRLGATATPPPPQAAPPNGSSTPEGGKGTKTAVGSAVVAPPEALSGKLTQAEIGHILESNGDVFGDCYTLGAGGKTKDFKGIVTVKATIGPSGTVNQVDVTKSTANNPKVDACVREAFKKIKFPHPRDGATCVITFPISFNGVEQIQ